MSKLVGGLIIMTNERILNLLYEMNLENSDFNTIKAYKSLVEGIKDNIRTSANKAVGKNTLAKNAKAIIKNAVKCCYNTALHGAWIDDTTGKQYVCDGFRVLEINNPIDLPPLSEDIKAEYYFKAYEIIKEARQKDSYDLEIPSVQELRAGIKITRSKMPAKEKRSKKSFVITLIDEGLTLNAQYLLEMSEALGGVKTIKVPVNYKGNEPVYAENDIGVGLILPIKNTDRPKGYWY